MKWCADPAPFPGVEDQARPLGLIGDHPQGSCLIYSTFQVLLGQLFQSPLLPQEPPLPEAGRTSPSPCPLLVSLCPLHNPHLAWCGNACVSAQQSSELAQLLGHIWIHLHVHRPDKGVGEDGSRHGEKAGLRPYQSLLTPLKSLDARIRGEASDVPTLGGKGKEEHEILTFSACLPSELPLLFPRQPSSHPPCILTSLSWQCARVQDGEWFPQKKLS